MADRQVRRLSITIWVLTVLGGLAALPTAAAPPALVIVGSAAIAISQLVSVPAPSGERLYLGIAVAAAVPLLVDDVAAAVAVFAFGLAGSWLVAPLFRSRRRPTNATLITEALSLAAYGTVYFTVAELVAAGDSDWLRLLALAAAGAVWYSVRAFLQSLIGVEREDLSVRYLWLLALEDWAAVVSIFIAGALFGLAWPDMRWWALPIALIPYAFSHLAFVRYHNTRVTYRQMIRALGQIPEVAGLAPRGHATRTADLAVAIARELGVHPEEVVELEYAALMHDVGRITLNEPAILRAGYTDEDIARWGAQIIAEAPHLAHVADLVRIQHQPYRRAGQERDPQVPMASKILKVASAFDRAEKEMGLAAIDALELVHRGSAYDFDPEVTASLRRVLAHREVIAR
jgi:hypothetical protein